MDMIDLTTEISLLPIPPSANTTSNWDSHQNPIVEPPHQKDVTLNKYTKVGERNHVNLVPFFECCKGVLRLIIVTCSLANRIKFSKRFHWNKPSLNSTCFFPFKKWSDPMEIYLL
jgi:hypothetical protein